jgi:hypothetical protein
MQTIKEDNRQARALPTSQSVIQTPISAAAFVALSASSMRLLLEHQQGSKGAIDAGWENMPDVADYVRGKPG